MRGVMDDRLFERLAGGVMEALGSAALQGAATGSPDRQGEIEALLKRGKSLVMLNRYDQIQVVSRADETKNGKRGGGSD